MSAVVSASATAVLTMDSLELVDFINSERREGEAVLQHRDFTAKVPKVIGEGVCEKFRIPYVNPQNGQTYTMYRFPKREACLMAMSYSYELQAKVFDRMTMLEEQAKGAQFAIPQSLPEALRLAADLSEQKAVAEAQRDEAVRTKAEIGTRREATAMATASAAIRQVGKLQAELGRNQQHATVLAVERATGRQFPTNAYVGLRAATKQHGLAPVNVVDARYGSVKAWPAIAWREAFGIELADIFTAEPAGT